MENAVLASTYCLFRIHKLASFTTHRLEIAGDFIHFFDEDENSVYSLNSIYPVLSFPLNNIFNSVFLAKPPEVIY